MWKGVARVDDHVYTECGLEECILCDDEEVEEGGGDGAYFLFLIIPVFCIAFSLKKKD